MERTDVYFCSFYVNNYWRIRSKLSPIKKIINDEIIRTGAEYVATGSYKMNRTYLYRVSHSLPNPAFL